MIHELKILPKYFKAVREGTKTFEIRKNDRGFKAGDTLVLQECYEETIPFSYNSQNKQITQTVYTGKEITKEISYILEGGQYGLEEGYCILGLKAAGTHDILNQLLGLGLDAKTIQETYERYKWSIDYYKDAIKLQNIDLSGISLTDELYKRDEEIKEFTEALLTYLYDPNEENKNHLLEEGCDNFQVILSLYSMFGIDIPEITEYWNTKHLEKIKDRPRKGASL